MGNKKISDENNNFMLNKILYYFLTNYKTAYYTKMALQG